MFTLIRPTYRILLLWFVLNVLQAATTGLMNDETYYWVYTQFPAWGYLDHPPAIMAMIWPGDLIMHHPLTTRLLTIILSTGFLALLMRILPGKRPDLHTFLPLFLSFPLLHFFGFITVPDAPLLFFTALYFLALKRFLRNDDPRNTFLLLVAVTGMIYAKYHAVLILFFTLLALPQLLVHRRFYFIAITSALLYLPHILWQVNNDYPSLQYHLFERAEAAYRLNFTTKYLFTQLLVLGPLSFWIVLRAAIHFLKRFPIYSNDPEQRFLRVMQLQFWGFFGFFFLMSFRGLVEGNWTCPFLIPAVYLTYVYLQKSRSSKWHRISVRFFIASALLVLALRFAAAIPMGHLSTKGPLREIHHNATWAREVHEYFGDLPVVFYDGYKYPSVYWYHEGIASHAESSITYRLTQYDSWRLDSLFTGKKVAWIGGMPKKEKFSLEHSFGAVSRYMIDTCFYSLNTLRVDVPVPPEWTASRPMPLTVTVTNTQHDSLHLPDSYPFGIAWSLKSDKQVVDTLMMQPITQLHWGPAESQTYEVQVDRWPDPGTYVARVSLQKAWFLPTLNGDQHKFTLKE